MATQDGVAPNVDLIVHTTLEPWIQDAARANAIAVIRKSGPKVHASQAAVVVMKPDGAVVALVGGTDYDESTFNRATQAHRQPGSAFKPFVYLAALESGLTPWDVRADEPVDIDGWTPTNFGGRSYGTLTLADALAHSVNTITANLAQEVGVSAVVGGGGAAASVAAGGERLAGARHLGSDAARTDARLCGVRERRLAVSPYFVTEVDDNGGHVLYQRKPPEPQRIIAEHVNKDLVAMLYGVVTEGTGPRGGARRPRGRRQDRHDAGFPRRLVRRLHHRLRRERVGRQRRFLADEDGDGRLAPAAIWRDVMTVAEKGKPATPLDKSSPQAPVEDEMVDVSASEPSTTGDDETGNARTETSEQQQREERGDRRGGFFDWLFGRKNTPPPPPPPPQNNDDDDNDSN